ncbi:MAG: hypothetical protein QOF76_3191 [Solirubrobacteraceae bacterium]|nr:hypothetical protein [Solirubrobacteraceae bacterium]
MVRLPNLIRDHARDRSPDLALVYGERRTTYAEFDERTNRLAQALLDAGVTEGDRVAYLDQNAPECLELLFAASKTGAVLVPLNWRLAAPELRVVMGDAGARLLVCGPDYAGLGLAERQIVTGDEYEAWIAGFDAVDPGFVGDDDTVVFQLYTSGTTGQPKGVQTNNRNLGSVTRIADDWNVDAESVSLVAMPLFHIGGTGWFLTSFYSGARVILIRSVVPDQLLDTMERERVTNAFLVPTVLQMLCALEGAADRDWSALRSIAYGASPITTTVLKRAMQTFGCPLFQVYGLTETTGAITQLDAADHDPGGPREHLLRSAGRPYAWVELKIADGEGHEVAPRAVGEVFLRGPAVTPGYYGKPEETARALDADGWLHTGDGGYVDEEGYLFLTDRIKDMIVTGAENVYPIEVEEVLAAHPAVGEVAVIGTPDEKWGELVTAVIVPVGDGDPDADELLAYAKERLAGYKLPRQIYFAGELPKTASGKVLKRDLRETYAP